MQCPRCHTLTERSQVKNGFVKCNQRFLCKECDYRYTINDKRAKFLHKKRIAIILYIEGIGLREIADYVVVSRTAVNKWLEGFGIKRVANGIRGTGAKVEGKALGLYYAFGDNKYPQLLRILQIEWEIKRGDHTVLYTIGNKRDLKAINLRIPVHLKRVALILYILGYNIEQRQQHIGSYYLKTENWLNGTGLKHLLSELIDNNREIATKINFLHKTHYKNESTHWLTVGWDDDSDTVVITKKSKPWEITKYKSKSKNEKTILQYRKIIGSFVRDIDKPVYSKYPKKFKSSKWTEMRKYRDWKIMSYKLAASDMKRTIRGKNTFNKIIEIGKIGSAMISERKLKRVAKNLLRYIYKANYQLLSDIKGREYWHEYLKKSG